MYSALSLQCIPCSLIASQQTPHSSSVRARYGVSFVNYSLIYVLLQSLQHCIGYHILSLQWRRDGRASVWKHQPPDCLLKRLFRRRSKKTSKLRVTDLCLGNSPLTGNFPAQRFSNAERFPLDNVIMWNRVITAPDCTYRSVFKW